MRRSDSRKASLAKHDDPRAEVERVIDELGDDLKRRVRQDALDAGRRLSASSESRRRSAVGIHNQ